MQQPRRLAVPQEVAEQSGSKPLSSVAGGGEMGAAIRSFDWSRTPLGAIEGWPLSLRTATNIGLSSRFAILVWWGPEFTMIYNDAYREIIAAKHPAALGQSGKECWNEIWDIIGPMLDSVVSTGQPTWSDDLQLLLERNGYPEECYFTFSYGPIWDESGKVGGVFTPVTETTDRVIGERRLRTLRDLAVRSGEPRSIEQACNAVAAALATNPYDIPFALLYLTDSTTQRLRLAAYAGIDPDGPASPRLVDVGSADPWPLAAVARTGKPQRVDDITDRCGALPSSAWGVSPSTAVVLPVALPGQSMPTAVLVLGVSPRKRLDAAYETFFSLIAGQVAAALAEALAYEEERRRAEALAELDRVKTAFFSNVSHEFRTPLTLLLGPIEDLLAKPRDALAAADREQLEIAHRNGLRLLKLVNTLLDFSRIEGSRMQAVYEATDLAAFTADLASSFRSAVEHAGMRLIVDCPPLPAPAYVDRDMWEKIVLNLLSNAFKFTLAGEIAVAVRPVSANIELSVRDTGCGIPAEEIPHLFERFHRLAGAQARTHEGSGIGLALVHELVKLHGGSVGVQSVCGRGSTFLVTIPTGRAHLPADHVTDARPSRSLGAAPYVEEALRWVGEDTHGAVARVQPVDGQQAPRILLADDNSDMRAYIQRLLGDRYQVEAVADGVAALAAARARPPDLVLTDIMMPGLDGLALLRELRADARTNTIPVIVISARAGDELRVQGLEAHADDYLVKPFSARELLARVRTHLEVSRLHREAARREMELRAKAEAAQQHASEILESITAGFVAVDGDWRLTYANAAAERVLGRSRADLIGKTFWEEFSALLGTAAETHLRRAMNEQVTVSFENHYGPSGRLFEVKAYPDRNGGVSVYFSDVTQHWLVEETLRQSDQRYREAVDLLPAGVYVCDASGIVIEHNRRATELWGRELHTDAQERFSGALRLYRPDGTVLPHSCTPTAEVLRTGTPVYDRELMVERPDGSRITVVENVAPLRDRLGKISGVVNCFHDISDRKRAEATRSHLAAIVESSDDAIFSKTLDGTITSWNQGAERLFGYTADEVIGRSVELLIAADRGDEEPEILARLRRGERIDHYETLRLHKDGHPLHVLVTVSPVKDHDGIIIGASDITHDITERKRIEATLREADRQKDQFLALLSHELRNPLAPIRNAVHLLRRIPLHDPLLERARAMIERQATHMTHLIDDLLDISRITCGKIVLRNRRVNVGDVVRTVADDHHEVFESGGIVLHVDVPADPVWVTGDATRLSQAVGNLLLNAAKFTDPGGRVHLYLRTESSQAVIGVHDTGIGMDHDAVQQVFDAFHQSDDRRDRNRSGLGLGLALVKSIAELHAGVVQARSEGLGRGAEFIIQLPLDSASATTATLPPSSAPHAPRPCRVLVIEDNVDTAESMKLLLSYDGYHVAIAHSGADGVRAAREFGAEVIVCDIGLPGDLDGYAVARTIRQDPVTSFAYLIALTGYGQEDDQRRARAAGFDLHLTKPIDFPALQHVLASVAASPDAHPKP